MMMLFAVALTKLGLRAPAPPAVHLFVREDLEGAPQEWRVTLGRLEATEIWTAADQEMSRSGTRLTGTSPDAWFARRCAELLDAGWRYAGKEPATP
ncbi:MULTISPECIES: hypothetical protein [unclassified Microbispora]|uniref:hypothetical protein n=1 Tax=unclassified Microbispora TaxID=2614687 RepID=UPI00160437BC|nr:MULTISPECIES: hypothetical protein [unclassified Microbispora]